MTFLADRVTNVPVSFRQLRMKDAEGVLQEGVVGATDLKVVQRAAGADQSADFSVGAGWIRIDSGTRSGLVHVYNDAVANIAATAANGTNPRVDIAVVRYNDTSIPAGTGGNTPTPEIIPGTATAGAQITNAAGANYRAGAPAVPNDCLLLADLLRPTATNPITTANIVDRRPWARGAYWQAKITAGNYTNPSTTMVDIDPTNLKPRIECSGVPLRVTLQSYTFNAGINTNTFRCFLDGATVHGPRYQVTVPAAAASCPASFMFVETPTVGSHVVALQWAVSASTGTIAAGVNDPLVMTVEEIVRPNASNT